MEGGASVMNTFNQALGAFFALLFSPFEARDPWWGILSISGVAGVLMLFVFRAATNQGKIRAIRDRIKAHLLEIRLYKDDFGLLIEAQKGILRSNLQYLKECAVPALLLAVPMALLIVHTGLWFDHRPLTVGEATVVTMKFKDNASFDREATLRAPEGIDVETPPLRIFDERAVMWRISAKAKGSFQMECVSRAGVVTKSVQVDDALCALSVRRVSSGFFSQLLHAAENALPQDTGLAYIEVAYPRINYQVAGRTFHWLVVFVVVSLLVALVLKWLCRVEI